MEFNLDKFLSHKEEDSISKSFKVVKNNSTIVLSNNNRINMFNACNLNISMASANDLSCKSISFDICNRDKLVITSQLKEFHNSVFVCKKGLAIYEDRIVLDIFFTKDFCNL